MRKKTDVKAAYDAYCEGSYEDFDELRQAFFNAVEANGVDGTLEALGFPADREAIWFKVNTGNEATLEELLSRYELNDEITQLGYTLENWLPEKGHPNPIIARSLALSEDDAIRELIEHIRSTLERSPTFEEFARDFNQQGATLPDGGYWVGAGKVTLTFTTAGSSF